MPRYRKRCEKSARSGPRVAIGYARVSTPRQVQEGVSLDMQREAIAKLCAAHGWQLQEVCSDEGISGRSRKRRKGLEEAVQKVCDSGGVLVSYNLSRLARSAGDAETICESLQQHGADLVSVTEPIDTTSAIGRAFFGIVSVFARLQSDLAGEQVAAANAHTVAELGYRTQGAQPTGYALQGRTRTERPDERLLIDRIVLYRREGLTTPEIADRLNDDGVPTITARRGYQTSGRATPSRWHGGTVYHLLQRHAPDLCRVLTRAPFLWNDARRKQLGTATDAALAEKWGCNRVTITRERLRLKIKAHKAHDEKHAPHHSRD